MTDRAETVKIDDDDGRFLLVVTTEHGDRFAFDIHAIALEVEAEVRRELRPYALEAQHARATMPPSYDAAEAYALDDPKHPTYHDRMSSIYDDRRGK